MPRHSQCLASSTADTRPSTIGNSYRRHSACNDRTQRRGMGLSLYVNGAARSRFRSYPRKAGQGGQAVRRSGCYPGRLLRRMLRTDRGRVGTGEDLLEHFWPSGGTTGFDARYRNACQRSRVHPEPQGSLTASDRCQHRRGPIPVTSAFGRRPETATQPRLDNPRIVQRDITAAIGPREISSLVATFHHRKVAGSPCSEHTANVALTINDIPSLEAAPARPPPSLPLDCSGTYNPLDFARQKIFLREKYRHASRRRVTLLKPLE